MNRRQMLATTGVAGAALGLGRFSFGWTAPLGSGHHKILMYTRSETFEHPVVKRHGSQLSLAERTFSELGAKHGFQVTCEKDGRVFLSDTFKDYDGFFFQSQGDLCSEKSVDGQPAMPAEGKKLLLQAIAGGKAFTGCHCAADTFHSAGYPGNRWEAQSREQVDPYIAMIGGEFASHGAQQRSWMKVTDKHFPGIKGLGDFGIAEEWYSLKNFSPDLHVILVQETKGMKGFDYERADFPATWARQHEKGRVFYTSMGHREDVWENPVFHQILLGGLSWALGNVMADVSANLDKVTPKANVLPHKNS